MGLRAIAAPLITAALLASASAVAEAPTRRDPAAAEALFQAALSGLDAGDWKGACPKFSASFDLDPTPSALLNVAKCHAHDNKLALAWADCQRALVLNRETPGEQRRHDLDAYARRFAAELEPRLPKLRVTVSNPATGATVARDGEALPIATIGLPIPVDPGRHELTASAPGFVPQTKAVVVNEGATIAIDFALDPGSASPAQDGASPAPRPPTWAWIAGGAGIACAGASVAFFVDQRGTQNDIDKQCRLPAHHCGSFDPSSDNARLTRDFDLFLAFGIAGVVGIGAGVVGIVGARSPSTPSGTAVWIAPRFRGAAIEGTF